MLETKNLSVWTLSGLALALLVPASAWAQRGAYGGGIRGGSHGGGFRGGFAGGHVGGFRGGYAGGFRTGFGGSGYFRGGYPGFARRGYFYRPFYGGFYGYPGYGFSASFGNGYGPSYYYGPPSYVYNEPYPVYYTPSYPMVVERDVVQYRGPDRDYEREVARTVPTERYWLIALQDKTILAVTGYWLEGSALNYVTRQGSKSSAELSTVDLNFTRQLNRERGVEFQLPRSSDVYQPRRLDSYGRPY